MSNFDKILEKIENQHIEPTPKWFFKMKNLCFWAVFVFSIIIGSVSFSIIVYSIQQTDFELLSHFSHSKIETFFVLIPYFWLISLLLFSVLSFFSFKNFKKAYKYSLLSILGLSIFLSILIGTVLLLSGLGEIIEKKFANQVEFYRSIEEEKMLRWMNPDKGFLAGTIVNVKKDTLIFKDFNHKLWTIYHRDIFIPPILEITEGENIKLIGKMQSENTFEAFEIRPWQGFDKQNRNRHRKGQRK